jgi:tetratricopeptide (TPR) repeat protein
VLSPGSVDVRLQLMQLDAARGAIDDLQRIAHQSLEIDPGNAVASAYAAGSAPFPVARNDYAAWFAFALSETGNGRDLNAAIAYRQALKFDARSSDALNNLGWTLGRLGFRSEARDALMRALAIRPGFELASNNLRWVESLK